MNSPRTVKMSRRAAAVILASVREERRQRLEARCRDSFHEFFLAGFGVTESTTLETTPWIKAQCDAVQAWLEGWFVAQGRDDAGRPRKATVAMVERQEAHWRRELAGVDGADALLATEPWFDEPLVQDLVINGYPGSLKSRIAMVYALAWAWIFDPTFAMAATSGTGSNVGRDSNMCKELVKSTWYRETFRIEWRVGVNRSGEVSDSQELWTTSAGGYRLSKELYSSWQGVHVDMLAVDDPDDAHKVWGEADRLKARSKVTALRNRTAHPLRSLRLIVQQNVHPEDVTYHALSDGPWSPTERKKPAHLAIPLQFRPERRCRTPWGWTDPRTEYDDVSHPSRYTPQFIQAERVAYGSMQFESQYNCNPSSSSNGWFGRGFWSFAVVAGHPAPLRERPHGCRDRVEHPAHAIAIRRDGMLDLDFVDLSVDATFGSLKDTASAVGMGLVGGKGGRRFVLLDSTKPRTFTELEQAIRDIVAGWTLSRIDRLLIEAKAQGTAVMDRLTKAMEGGDPNVPRLLGPDGNPIVIKIEPIETGTAAKVSRARAFLPAQEAGLIHVLDGAEWVAPWIDELSAFPFGKRDDRVDYIAQALAYRASHGTATEALRRDIEAMRRLGAMR